MAATMSETLNLPIDSEEHNLRLKRQESNFVKKLAEFVSTVSKMNELAEDLSLEVIELKSARKTLNQDLQKSIHQSFSHFTPIVAEALVNALNDKTKNTINTYLDNLKCMQNQAESTTAAIRMLYQQEQSRLTRTSLFSGITVFLSAFLMAASIFYFFPQHQYSRYEITQAQISHALLGKALQNNFQKLDAANKEIILNAFQDEYKHMLMGTDAKSEKS